MCLLGGRSRHGGLVTASRLPVVRLGVCARPHTGGVRPRANGLPCASNDEPLSRGAAMTLAPATRLGPYEIAARIGAGASRPRGAARLQAESPSHLHDPRRRRVGGADLHRHGAGRGAGAEFPPGGVSAVDRPGPALRPEDGRCARARPRARCRASRLQERQRGGDAGRADQGPGLRAREAAEGRAVGRRHDRVEAVVDRTGDGSSTPYHPVGRNARHSTPC